MSKVKRRKERKPEVEGRVNEKEREGRGEEVKKKTSRGVGRGITRKREEGGDQVKHKTS